MPQNLTDKLRTILEEELGETRALADLPSSEIDLLAVRLARAIAPVLKDWPGALRRNAA